MSISKTYNPADVEDKWYRYWLDHDLFSAKVNHNKEPYTIVIPPPNVTGVLHMGHMLNNTIQDILIRKARMEGREACWVPGTDHASIATEAKVVAMLKERGLDKAAIGREEFLKYAWEWKEKYGGIILEQLKRLGASCDWKRTAFTMDPDYYQSVIRVFVDLHEKGLIYRGVRMVNWDPLGKTALSDDEVIHKEVQSKLYYIKYQIEHSDEYLTIATVRPETIMADSAICVNPNDERYQHLKGKKAIIPLINRSIPIIEDEYVAIDFGTGCLKVTPAHDLNDYELGMKHNLPVIDILNDNGTLNERAEILIGEDRFVARKKIGKLLEESGNLAKVEDYKSKVGYSERTDAVIEPRLSMQWFLKMEDVSKPALENVLNNKIELIPDKFLNTYRHWMENVKDWCISRQLWWGHRIPAWYNDANEFVVASTKEEAIEKFRVKGLNFENIRQDEDVLDTWFSSWLWPIAVFDPELPGSKSRKPNEELSYFYPTNTLVTAPEILFFWVARMIIAGYEWMDEKPFTHVYLTGIVRDKLGRKMSKSLGNSPDPFDLIAKYGADGVRAGMLFSSPAGNDLPFDEKLCEQGRNFSNKIWNVLRLIKGWEVTEGENSDNQIAIDWFRARYNEQLTLLEDHFSKFRISDALLTVYKLIWDDFCALYLEMVKPEYQQPIDRKTYNSTIGFFEKLLKILHPFMPFITEELWHEIRQDKRESCILISDWPTISSFDKQLINNAERVFSAIAETRNARNAKQVSPKIALNLNIRTNTPEIYLKFAFILKKLGNFNNFQVGSEKPDGAASFIIRSDEFYLDFGINTNSDLDRIEMEKELQYMKGFIESVQKKLSNEKFVQNAKAEIVENERRKMVDAEAKIKAIEENLLLLKQN